MRDILYFFFFSCSIWKFCRHARLNVMRRHKNAVLLFSDNCYRSQYLGLEFQNRRQYNFSSRLISFKLWCYFDFLFLSLLSTTTLRSIDHINCFRNVMIEIQSIVFILRSLISITLFLSALGGQLLQKILWEDFQQTETKTD